MLDTYRPAQSAVEQHGPRARIEAFLADYAAAHAEVKPLSDRWKEETCSSRGLKTAALATISWRSAWRDIAGSLKPALQPGNRHD